MKHKEIWLTVGEAFITEPDERTWGQDKLTELGLCVATERLGLGFEAVFDIHNPNGLYWLPVRQKSPTCCFGDSEPPHTREHDLIRGTFACLMAAMSEKEYNNLVG